MKHLRIDVYLDAEIGEEQAWHGLTDARALLAQLPVHLEWRLKGRIGVKTWSEWREFAKAEEVADTFAQGRVFFTSEFVGFTGRATPAAASPDPLVNHAMVYDAYPQVLAHEIGHWLRLRHTRRTQTIMDPYFGPWHTWHPDTLSSFMENLKLGNYEWMTGGSYAPGDINADGTVNMADVIALLNHLYKGGDLPPNPDSNGDGSVDISDAVHVLKKVVSNE